MISQIGKILLCGIVSLFIIPNGFCYSISPIAATLSPDGKNSTKNFQVTNDGDEDLTLDVSIAKRVVNETGVEKPDFSGGVASHFVIYPPMLVIKARSSRTVRVAYVGEKKLEKEQSYRLVFQQINVSKERKVKGMASLNFNMNILATLFVSPDDAKPNIVVTESSYFLDKKTKKPMMSLVFENKGTKHKKLINYSLTLTTEGKTKKTVVLNEKIKDAQPINGWVILAGNKIRAIIPWPKEFADKSKVKAEIEFK